MTDEDPYGYIATLEAEIALLKDGHMAVVAAMTAEVERLRAELDEVKLAAQNNSSHLTNLLLKERATNAELVAALREVVSSLETLGEDGWSDAPHLMSVCRAAIAKAGGKEC